MFGYAQIHKKALAGSSRGSLASVKVLTVFVMGLFMTKFSTKKGYLLGVPMVGFAMKCIPGWPCKWKLLHIRYGVTVGLGKFR